jgi:hypothetical protein
MVALPVSVNVPRFLSKEQLLGATGTAGGLIFSDYLAASIISRLGWTGGMALAAAAAGKIALGIAMYWGASKMSGGPQTILGLASVGCVASVLIDVVRYVWPMFSSVSARLGAAFRGVGRPAVTAGVGGVVVRAGGVPAGIRVRAETPAAYSLGGF